MINDEPNLTYPINLTWFISESLQHVHSDSSKLSYLINPLETPLVKQFKLPLYPLETPLVKQFKLP